jgi:hypothetical protein
MSSRELDRLHSLQRMANRRATQRQTAEALGLTVPETPTKLVVPPDRCLRAAANGAIERSLM